MAAGDEFKNPPIIKSEPANTNVLVYEAASDTWVPTAIASIGSPLTVPGTHIAAASAPTGESSSAVVTTAPTQSSPFGFVGAPQAAAISTTINTLVTDVGTLVTELGTLTTKYNTLLTELQTAGILASS